MWFDDLKHGVSSTHLWDGYIVCGECSGWGRCRLSKANRQVIGNASRAQHETAGRHHRRPLNSHATRKPRLSAFDKSVSRKFEACA